MSRLDDLERRIEELERQVESKSDPFYDQLRHLQQQQWPQRLAPFAVPKWGIYGCSCPPGAPCASTACPRAQIGPATSSLRGAVTAS